jgi:glutathione S-transferase
MAVPSLVDAAVAPWLLRAPALLRHFTGVQDALEGHPRLQAAVDAYRCAHEQG